MSLLHLKVPGIRYLFLCNDMPLLKLHFDKQKEESWGHLCLQERLLVVPWNNPKPISALR